MPEQQGWEEEARLFEAARAGDLGALADLFHRRRGLLHRVAWEILHDHDLGADVVQDTFLDLAGNLDAVRNPMAIGKYLITMVRNKAVDALRESHGITGTSLRGRRIGLELADNEPDWSTDPAGNVAALEDVRAIGAVWRQLSHRDARLLGLLVLGYDLDEIAALEGIKRVAAKVAIHRARAKLRELLGMPIAIRHRVTECPRGHRYDDANTYRTRAGRECRTCKLATDREKRAAAALANGPGVGKTGDAA